MNERIYVTAVVEVDTLACEPMKAKEHIEELLMRAPKIRGKRYDAGYYVNIPPGHNAHLTDKSGKITKLYQTCAIITVFGSIEDSTLYKVEREYEEFLRYLRETCHFLVLSELVNIKE